MENESDIIIYQTNDGLTKVDVKFEGETVWLSQEQMATLFQRDKSVITRHIHNIYEEGELELESTSAKYAFVPESRERSYEITYYNLEPSGRGLPTDHQRCGEACKKEQSVTKQRKGKPKINVTPFLKGKQSAPTRC